MALPADVGTAHAGQRAAQIWRRYAAQRDPELREQLILEHAPLVRYVVDRLGLSLAPYLDRDDLIGHGITGLMEAVDNYDPSQRTQFRTYAVQRIRGAVLDAVRALDLVPRGARRWARRVGQAVAELGQELGRRPTEAELAERLEVSLETYRQRLTEMAPLLVSLDTPLGPQAENDVPVEELLEDPEAVDPDEYVEEVDLRARLRQVLLGLGERQRLIVSLYYNEELTLKEIGAVLGVTESRISQILSQTLLELRGTLGELAPAARGGDR